MNWKVKMGEILAMVLFWHLFKAFCLSFVALYKVKDDDSIRLNFFNKIMWLSFINMK